MNDLEDRLRDAYRAAAATLRPEAIRDLHVAVALPAARRQPRLRLPKWGRDVLIPLSAAVAVAALVVAMAAVVPHLGGTGARPAGGAAGSMPEFTVVTADSTLRVVQTTTGQLAGQVTAPAHQQFVAVAGTAGDRTFWVLADPAPQTDCATFLYKLRLSDGGQPSALAPLAVPALTDSWPNAAFAVSADGSTAAVSADTCGNQRAFGYVDLVDLGTGHLIRRWSYTKAENDPIDLSLSAGGSRLALTTDLNGPSVAGVPVTGVRVLNTSAASGTEDSASRVVIHKPQGVYAAVDAAAISPDGGTLYACTLGGRYGSSGTNLSSTLAAYSASTGQMERVLFQFRGDPASSCGPAIMDPSGRYLVFSGSPRPVTSGPPSASQGCRPASSPGPSSPNESASPMSADPYYATSLSVTGAACDITMLPSQIWDAFSGSLPAGGLAW
jgi:hypothetical protein